MTRRPRTIHTVTNDLNHDQRMQRICSTLTRAGFEVLLVGRERRVSKPLGEQVFNQKRLRCWFEKGPLFYLEFNWRLFIFLLNSKFDILNTIDLDTMPGGLAAAFFKRKKRVFDAHEWFSEVPEVVGRPVVKKVWEMVGWLGVRFYDRCYTVGECLAGAFTDIYGKRFEVIRNLPLSRLTASITAPLQPRVILYQGALNEGRGIEASIMAMKWVEFAELWLAGEGDLSEILRKLVAENNLENRVKFLGQLRPEELRDLTSKAWIGLNLLENRGLSYYFSLANKFFDYIQAGVPSLNMNFPEYQKICATQSVGLLLDNCQPQTIAAAIRRLKEDENLHQKLAENCAAAARIFNWEKEEPTLINLYRFD